MAKLGRIAAFGASGLLAGVGKGMVQAGMEKREQALRELEMRFRSDEATRRMDFEREQTAGSQAFTRGENVAAREATAEQGALGREFQAGESAADRASREREGEAGRAQTGLLARDTFTDKDGKVWRYGPSGTAEPVTDASGNQLQGVPPRSATSDPLVKVKSEDGTPIYVPRSEAAGLPAYVEKDEDATALTPEERAVKLRKEAAAMAEAEAYERDPAGPDFISSDEEIKKAYDGLTPEAWVEKRTREIEAELRGGGTQAPDEAETEAETPAAGAPPEKDAAPAEPPAERVTIGDVVGTFTGEYDNGKPVYQTASGRRFALEQ